MEWDRRNSLACATDIGSFRLYGYGICSCLRAAKNNTADNRQRATDKALGKKREPRGVRSETVSTPTFLLPAFCSLLSAKLRRSPSAKSRMKRKALAGI